MHQQQIASAKAELRAKRASQQTVSSVPKAPGEGKVFHSHQVPTTKATATRQTVKSVESITIKTSERTIKTAGPTVKTVEHMGGTAIKSTQAAAETAQKTAMIAAQSAHRSRVAARAASAIAKKTAEYTARAAKAIAQAMQELISVAAAGGGTVLILVIVLIVMCFAGMMLASDENDTEILPVSDEVKAYEPIIQKYAKEHGIPDYVLLIEAVMMQESGGRGTDPMQCSECNFNTLYPHTPGSITDPEYSIDVGMYIPSKGILLIAAADSNIQLEILISSVMEPLPTKKGYLPIGRYPIHIVLWFQILVLDFPFSIELIVRVLVSTSSPTCSCVRFILFRAFFTALASEREKACIILHLALYCTTLQFCF